MKKYGKGYWTFRILFLIGYLAMGGLLAYEATIPDKENEEEVSGEPLLAITNDLVADQAREILPTKAVIKNKKLDYKIGEEITLEVATSPVDATYKSYIYYSSNPYVASVSESGAVSFLASGSAIVRAINTKAPTVYGEITFNVSEVPVTKMTSTINANKEDNTYLLEIYKSYLVTNSIEPKNATDKTVTYEIEENDYIEIVDDTIKVIGDSGDQIIRINVKCGDITNVLKVATFAPTPVIEDFPLTGISADDISKYVDEVGSFVPNVTYLPAHASNKFKGYTLQSDNTAVATIVDNKVNLTGTVGTANITITSTSDNTIKSTFLAKTLNRPEIASVKLGHYSPVMYLNGTQSVTANPSDNDVKVLEKTYTSSNASIISVNDNGKLVANDIGTATITVRIKDSYNNEKEASFDVEVKQKLETDAASFVVNYKVSENPIIHAEQEIDLNTYFGIKSFIGNSLPLDNNAFDFIFNITNEEGEYHDHKFIAHKVGEIYGQMTFTNEDGNVLTNDIKFTAVDDFSVYQGEHMVTDLSFDVYTTHILTVKDNNKAGQTYKVLRENNTVVTSYINKSITLTTKESGEGNIKIIPIIKQDGLPDKELSNYAKTVTFSISDILTSKIDVSITHKNGDEAIFNEEPILLYMNDTLNVKYLLDEKTTKSKIKMSLNNNNATIRNGLITPKRLGNVTLTVKDEETGLIKEFEITIKHKVALNDSSPLLLSGLASYDKENNHISITNGDSAKISVNFATDTSYKKVDYIVEDRSIADISIDGIITPYKAGITKASITVQDSSRTYIDLQVDIEVIKRPFVTDAGDFIRRAQKSYVYFLAFALFGLIGTLMWFLWLRRKLFFLGVFLNLAIGFGLTYLTEFIQTYISGRVAAWSDLVLHFSGFALMALAVTLLMVIIGIIRLIHKAKMKKKHPEMFEGSD